MKIKMGCKGCNRYWQSQQPSECPPEMRNQEGQCSQCKRCLTCCENENIEFSCTWKRKHWGRYQTPDQHYRSQIAKRAYLENQNILRGFRKA